MIRYIIPLVSNSLKLERHCPCCGRFSGNTHSSIERDVAAAGQKAKRLHFAAPMMRVRVIRVDGTGAKMTGKKAGLLFYVDVDTGRLICVEPVQQKD